MPESSIRQLFIKSHLWIRNYCCASCEILQSSLYTVQDVRQALLWGSVLLECISITTSKHWCRNGVWHIWSPKVLRNFKMVVLTVYCWHFMTYSKQSSQWEDVGIFILRNKFISKPVTCFLQGPIYPLLLVYLFSKCGKGESYRPICPASWYAYLHVYTVTCVKQQWKCSISILSW